MLVKNFLNLRDINSAGEWCPFLLLENLMDTIDSFVVFAAVLVILSIIVQLGSECASDVWQRTTAMLDAEDLLECNTVPLTTGPEALLILVAALIKKIGISPLTLLRFLTQKGWSMSPAARLAHLRASLRSDILLAVFTMISGYPERAALLYLDALRERLIVAENSTQIPARMVF